MTIALAIHGASGRMGRAIGRLAHDDPRFEIKAVLVSPESGSRGKDFGELALGRPLGLAVTSNVETALADVGVLVDFSRPEAAVAAVERCARAGCAAVIGTTGFDAGQKARIATAARQIPVVMAPNMSVGVNVLIHLVQQAGRALGESFDVEIVEAHHRHKVDAPSGTALRLGEVIAAVRGERLDELASPGRATDKGPRRTGSIGFASLRAGEIVGEHTVLFAGETERLELVHRAASRAAFAQGALRAAAWVVTQRPGLYTMSDVLGF